MKVRLEYGDDVVEVEAGSDVAVVTADGAVEPDPLVDPVGATRSALANPLGVGPIGDLVGRGDTVTIAFPDRVKGGTQPTAHRRVVVPMLLDELERAGVRMADVRLICAIGLHRKNREAEIADLLGPAVVERADAPVIVNHDAEDEAGMVDLGTSELGDVVQVNRAVVEADLSIMVSHAAGNPYGGYSGGYKMPSTGLTSWRSIAGHHSPRTLYRDDFVPPTPKSRFRDQLREIGRHIERAMPQPFFTVDAALDSGSRQLGVWAGRIPEVEQASWPVAQLRTDQLVDGPPADVLLVGMPRNFHYGKGMGSNPLLLMQAVGASVIRAKAALVDKPFVITTSVCDGWFNAEDFPSYEEAFDRLADCQHPADMVAHEEELATDERWITKYRTEYGYHPFHAFSMIYMGGMAREHSTQVYVAGARRPGMARAMGARTTATAEEALREAADILGRQPRVLVVPALSTPQFHLRATG
ncbi:lactate racemase domain-containing protein [Microlunatus sp. Y2014]|uniref:lactate racemase domain-containing protein n=1 Tax=Microlunatus sp. Y2014 TaxID=3418488 RepID=UPI003DA6D715